MVAHVHSVETKGVRGRVNGEIMGAAEGDIRLEGRGVGGSRRGVNSVAERYGTFML
jgi:hypothetical protein